MIMVVPGAVSKVGTKLLVRKGYSAAGTMMIRGSEASKVVSSP